MYMYMYTPKANGLNTQIHVHVRVHIYIHESALQNKTKQSKHLNLNVINAKETMQKQHNTRLKGVTLKETSGGTQPHNLCLLGGCFYQLSY